MNSNAEYTLEEIKSLIIEYAEHRKKGYSKESFVKCDYRTIERHLEVYESDLQSEKKEIEKSERENRMFWESLGIENIMNKSKSEAGIGSENTSLNSTVWIFNMKNRFPKEWRDKQEVENSVTINPIGTDAEKPDFK